MTSGAIHTGGTLGTSNSLNTAMQQISNIAAPTLTVATTYTATISIPDIMLAALSQVFGYPEQVDDGSGTGTMTANTQAKSDYVAWYIGQYLNDIAMGVVNQQAQAATGVAIAAQASTLAMGVTVTPESNL